MAVIGVAGFAVGLGLSTSVALRGSPPSAAYALGFGEPAEYYDSLEEAIGSSDLVVHGIVVSLERGRVVGDHEYPDTLEQTGVARVKILKVLKGDPNTKSTSVLVTGWHLETGLRVAMDYYMPVTVGNELVFVLRRIHTGDAEYRPITSGAALGSGRLVQGPSEDDHAQRWLNQVEDRDLMHIVESITSMVDR